MDLGDTLRASFNQVVNDLVTGLPAVIGAIVILIIGYIVAKVVSGIVRRLLDRSGIDRRFAQHGSEVYGSNANAMKPSGLAAMVTFWVIMLIFIVAAANFLGWPQVSLLLNNFLGWLPNLIVAVIILIAAPIVGRIVRRMVEGGSQQMGMSSGRMLGRIAEIGVIAFGVLIAINQVGIATDLVNILFIGIVAALAIALGLSFGLGGREVAAQVTQDWYNRSKEVSARAQEQMEASDSAKSTTTRRTTSAQPSES
jgi:hypothetical protein